MLTNLFTSLGWTRNDAKWLWGQIIGAAAIVASGVFDISAWAANLGISITPTELHWVTFIATVILWISGRYHTSNLPADPAKNK